MRSLKTAIRKAIPKAVVDVYGHLRRERMAARNARLTTEEVFTDIYTSNRWGGESGRFFSGLGSKDMAIVSPYIRAVTAELTQMGAAHMTAVDLGCGDYAVGRELSPACGRYIGVDIVKPLVAHNQAQYGNDTVSFLHANIVEDALPAGDVCFVRQVLQHLSNAQISAVLTKLERFSWAFITEHHPSSDNTRQPNVDKPHGDDIRLRLSSGVFLDHPPFKIPTHRYRLLLEVPGSPTPNGNDPGVIRTYMLSGSADARDAAAG